MAEETAPIYATAEEALAWKSPDPLEFDFTHSDTGQIYHVKGICKAKDRKVIYSEIARLKPLAGTLAPQLGGAPTDDDIQNACWAAECVTSPKMTAFQWLQFGIEASLDETAMECLVASRLAERRKLDAAKATVPDGEAAAEAELKADPT